MGVSNHPPPPLLLTLVLLMQDLNGTMEELEKNRRELDEMTKTMLDTEEDRDMFEDCNKKHG